MLTMSSSTNQILDGRPVASILALLKTAERIGRFYPLAFYLTALKHIINGKSVQVKGHSILSSFAGNPLY